MRVAIIGGDGQLGSELCAVFARRGHEIVRLVHDDIELSDFRSVHELLSRLNADVVVNSAAMANVPKCEENPETAFAVNAVGARNLAVFSRESGTKLVHISTDYVFDGAKSTPYVEHDRPLPLNVYGNSKLAGEHFIEAIATRYFILRTSGLYGKHPCRAKGHNFVDLMLKLARAREEVHVVADEILTPTSAVEVARQVAAVADTEAYGLYHATAEGQCSWHEFAAQIFAVSGASVRLKVAEPERFACSVMRPAYSVLENAALKENGLNRLGAWQDGLRDYLRSAVAIAS